MTLLKKIASLGGATALLIASATAAQARTYTQITGTFTALENILMSQPWWGNDSAALAAVRDARSQGITGQAPGTWGFDEGSPQANLAAVALNTNPCCDGGLNGVRVASTDYDYFFGRYHRDGFDTSAGFRTGPHTWLVVVEEPAAVPEPASLLGLVAVGGVGALMRRNLASSNEA